jgi:hypothetical protein
MLRPARRLRRGIERRGKRVPENTGQVLERKIEIVSGFELQAEPRLVTQGDVPPPNVGAMNERAGGEYSSLRHLVWEDSQVVSMTG